MEDSRQLLYDVARIFMRENPSVLCLKNLDGGETSWTLEGAGLRLIRCVPFCMCLV